MNLIIVESPTKAKTLSRFLGKDFRIEATMGHIRDLPKEKLGVDINRDFEPYYVVPKEKKKIVEKLRNLIAKSKKIELTSSRSSIKNNGRYKLLNISKIILATDLDREGEAIAWHTVQILNLDEVKSPRTRTSSMRGRRQSKVKNYKRIVFHEITRPAIAEALKHPRGIDMNLVNAQQGRRVLDRLVGYKLSPLLWYKTGKNWLSAGRVQSVAVRLIVEREREIEAFKPEEYWKIEVELGKWDVRSAKWDNDFLNSRFLEVRKEKSPISKNQDIKNSISKTSHFSHLTSRFLACLIKINEQKAEIRNKEQADLVVAFLEKAFYKVQSVKKDINSRYPPPPFITSTLQRAGANLFGWPARKTMTIAQNLYEHGLITYHRTDSVQLSKEALAMARDYINKVYGKEYLPAQARIYKTKSKLAQEAHEAIRPTDVWQAQSSKLKAQNKSKIPNSKFKTELGRDHQKMLDLISKRFLACQMREEEVEVTKVRVQGSVGKEESPTSKNQDIKNSTSKTSHFSHLTSAVLEAKGERQVFAGWRIVFASANTQIKNEKLKIKNEEKILPPLEEGEVLDLVKVLPQQKFTQPTARFNEASLIKALEEKGIGRPSTYAPIISTIQVRQYVEKEERCFKPTELGLAINDFLVENFGKIINADFTAKMEDKLDEIARGKLGWVRVIGEFWQPFEKKLLKVKSQKSKVKIELEEVDEKCPKDRGQLVVRIGKYGKFLACSNFPKCRFTKPIVVKVAAKCPKCSGDVVLKKSKKGRRFYGCANYPECNFASWRKPKSEKL